MMNVIVSRPQHNCTAYIRQFVVAQYRAAPKQAQDRARQFYHAMDTDGNGTVDYCEFKSFFHSEGFHQHTCRNLFMMLDRNGDHGLDFWEVMTLYYILKTGIPYYFCNNCHACRQVQPQHTRRRPSMQRSQISNAVVQPSSRWMQRSQTSRVMARPSRGHSMQRSQPMSNTTTTYSSNYQMVPFDFNQSTRFRDHRIARTAFRALEFTLGVANLVVGIANCSIM